MCSFIPARRLRSVVATPLIPYYVGAQHASRSRIRRQADAAQKMIKGHVGDLFAHPPTHAPFVGPATGLAVRLNGIGPRPCPASPGRGSALHGRGDDRSHVAAVERDRSKLPESAVPEGQGAHRIWERRVQRAGNHRRRADDTNVTGPLAHARVTSGGALIQRPWQGARGSAGPLMPPRWSGVTSVCGRCVAFLNSTSASTGRPAVMFTDTAYPLGQQNSDHREPHSNSL